MNKHEDNHQRINGVRVRDIRDPELKKAKAFRALLQSKAKAPVIHHVFSRVRRLPNTRQHRIAA